MSELSLKQQAFVNEYLVDFNGTRAAERAGYSQSGDDNVLAAQASRMLRDVNIKAAINERLRQQAMTAEEVIKRLGDMARTDLGPYFEPDEKTGKPRLNWDKLKEDGLSHLVKGIVPTRSGARFDFHDSQAALNTLAKRFGLLIDKTALTDPTGEKEYAGLPDDKRIERIVTVLDRARARRDRSATDSAGEDETD